MTVTILTGDAREVLRALPEASVQCVVTSPPYYGLRSYLPDGHPDKAKEIGLDQTPAEYVAEMVAVFREVRRVLRGDGVCFVNIGDSYAGSWGAQGRQGGTGLMASRSVSAARVKSAISAAQIAAHPHRQSNTGTIRQAGLKPKDRMMIPARLAIALCDDGWWLRDEIVWQKPNPMPSSVADRTTPAHEMVYLLTKSSRYFYDADAIAEPAVSTHPSGNGFKRDARETFKSADGTARGNDDQRTGIGGTRNRRSVWAIPTEPSGLAHFAMMPSALADLCIRAGSRPSDTVLDPFGGAGTTALVADRLQRHAIIIDLSEQNTAIARERINGEAGLFAPVAAE